MSGPRALQGVRVTFAYRDLADVPVGDVPDLQVVTSLDLSHNQITSFGFLKHFPHLRTLVLDHNLIASPIPRLPKRPSLTYLSVSANRIKVLEDALPALAVAFPNLASLSFFGNPCCPLARLPSYSDATVARSARNAGAALAPAVLSRQDLASITPASGGVRPQARPLAASGASAASDSAAVVDGGFGGVFFGRGGSSVQGNVAAGVASAADMAAFAEYRGVCIAALPSLTALDGVAVSEEEREEAEALYGPS
eukprot:TRINITY_DN6786_c0_g1_i1.p1 TRINITY_DN6786_c0_g1~~TRINITY_DN6786_c0_g1_i1.p1  ORF type:complete len:285 (-),score=24.63 TRINITY_DN6786_c0_g1_i1:67-825(-)